MGSITCCRNPSLPLSVPLRSDTETIQKRRLLPVDGIVGGINVQQNLTALGDLLATETKELIQLRVIQAHQIAYRRRVLPATKGGLGAERLSQSLIGDDLQQRIVAQAIGVVGVFVSGHDLIDVSPQATAANHGARSHPDADR